MRKLGIVITLCAAATLGFAGTASAQTDNLPVNAEDTQTDAGNVAKSALCPFEQGPVNGASGQCPDGTYPDFKVPPDQASVTKYVCGVINAGNTLVKNSPVGKGYEDAPANPVTDEIKKNCAVAGGCTKDCGPPGGNKPTSTGGGGGGGNAAVQAANAGGDGSLPRTGGELFAGAGFGLMSLGALVRRFLP